MSKKYGTMWYLSEKTKGTGQPLGGSLVRNTDSLSK